MELQEQ